MANDSYYDYYPMYPSPNVVDENKKKCTCGTSITLGKDDDIKFHSEWCDLRKDNKDEKNKSGDKI